MRPSDMFATAMEELEMVEVANEQDLKDDKTTDGLLQKLETEKEENKTAAEEPVESDTSPVDSDLESTDESTVDTKTEVESDSLEDTSKDKNDKEEEEDESSIKVDKSPLVPNEIEEEAEKIATEANSFFPLFDKGFNAIKSLEEIVEIIEASEESGGLSPMAAEMTDLVTNNIYDDLELSRDEISVESFKSVSGRSKQTTIALEKIQDKISKIISMIVSGIKAVIQFIQDSIKAYRANLQGQKDELVKLRAIYRGITQVDPRKDKLSSIFSQVLLHEKSDDLTSASVVATGLETLGIIESYVTTFRKDINTALDAMDNITEAITSENPFTEEDLKKYGKIFGVQLTPTLDKVTHIPGIIKTSDTIVAYESKLLAGNNIFGAFTANELNISADDILNSKFILYNVERKKEMMTGIDTADINDMKSLFDLIDKSIVISDKTFEITGIIDSKMKNMLKLATALEHPVAAQGSDSEYRMKAYLFSNLSKAFQEFYSKPLLNTVTFNNRYVKTLTSYCLNSLREYT